LGLLLGLVACGGDGSTGQVPDGRGGMQGGGGAGGGGRGGAGGAPTAGAAGGGGRAGAGVDAAAAADARSPDAKVCPHRNVAYDQYTCVDVCACWFENDHCSGYAKTRDVFKTFDDCLAGCATFTDLACRAYRVDNDDFHCPSVVPGAKCP
jgi:hypothetical protein